MKIAISAYQPRWHVNDAALRSHLDRFVALAAEQGAELLVFPEYAGLESVMTQKPVIGLSAQGWRDRSAARAEDWRDLNSNLAQTYGLHILAGSTCAKQGSDYVNRAYLCGPDGSSVHQDKLILTPYERSQMQLSPGKGLGVIETSLGKIGVLICYDSEFPLFARALAQAGAEMILVPSATDLQAGYTRVSQSCRARAIENQCLILQSPILGPVADCDVIDTGTGAAGAFCPPDYGLPQDGIYAMGPADIHGWTYVDVDPAAIAAPRQSGQVGNFAHWSEQDARINSVTTLALGPIAP